MRIRLTAVVGIVLLACTVGAQDFKARAIALHKQTPLIDGHNDYPWALRDIDPGRDLGKADITEPVPKLMTDIPRLRKGGVSGQFWSVYTPSTMMGKEATRVTMDEIDTVHRMTQRWASVFEIAYTADDVERAFKAGRIASMIGMEGGHSIDNSLAALRMFYRLGARYMTLSHSSSKAICNVPRNVPDNILQMVAKNGGVVMVTFVPGFISQAVADFDAKPEAER